MIIFFILKFEYCNFEVNVTFTKIKTRLPTRYARCDKFFVVVCFHCLLAMKNPFAFTCVKIIIALRAARISKPNFQRFHIGILAVHCSCANLKNRKFVSVIFAFQQFKTLIHIFSHFF